MTCRSFIATAAIFLSQAVSAQNTLPTTDAEVRKVDLVTHKITLKHGDIKNLDMPPMTMVFVVRDKTLLDKTTVGAKIQFMATSENGQMTVTDIQPTK